MAHLDMGRVVRKPNVVWYPQGARQNRPQAYQLQGQDPRWILKESSTVGSNLCRHCVELFHLVTSHVVDDLFETSDILIFFFWSFAFSK